ncbi:MAG: TatD family hydrolase [bacterium]|nr:TatD family hydrolase [bacterium]
MTIYTAKTTFDAYIYTDAHCHLHLPSLRSQLEKITSDNPQFCLVSASTGAGDWPLLENVQQEMRRHFPQSRFFICLGYHPQEAAKFRTDSDSLERALEQLERAVRSSKNSLAAVGEIGLDKCLIGKFPAEQREQVKSLQTKLLKAQLEIAQRYGKPAVLHCVRAHGALQDTLRHFPALPISLLHGFYGSPDLLRSYLKHGLYISLSASLLLRDSAAPDWPDKKLHWQVLADLLPLERLLLESDSCQNYDGSPTPPRTTAQTAAVLAELYRCSTETILEQAWSNLQNWLL